MNLSNYKDKLLDDYSEQELIKLLSLFQSHDKNLVKGIGDDCAICCLSPSNYELVYTSDATIQDIHFNINTCPSRIGNKAIGRVLSDFAAMGAEPSWILINLAIPQSYKVSDLLQIYKKIKDSLDYHQASIIGGDLTKADKLSFNIFGAGKIPCGKAIYRSGAKVNDDIWCTGKLGNSIKGKHLDFRPKIQEGKWLRESGFVNSMIDITDGLATDLKHLLSDNLGALLYQKELKKMKSSIDKILYDGEDYELLFTTNLKDSKDLCYNWKKEFDMPLYFLGKITNTSNNIYLKNEKSLKLICKNGYQHF